MTKSQVPGNDQRKRSLVRGSMRSWVWGNVRAFVGRPSLRDLGEFWGVGPSVETLGYFRGSLRDRGESLPQERLREGNVRGREMNNDQIPNPRECPKQTFASAD